MHAHTYTDMHRVSGHTLGFQSNYEKSLVEGVGRWEVLIRMGKAGVCVVLVCVWTGGPGTLQACFEL